MPVDKVDGYTNQCGTSEPNGAPINITFKFQYTCNGGTCPNDVTGKIKYMFYFLRGDVDCWKIDDHLGEGYEDNGSYPRFCNYF